MTSMDATEEAILLANTQAAIGEECDAIKKLLREKNLAYGNSAIDPVRIFSKASAEEQILVRLDDKVSRLVRGEAAGEDVLLDLVGYIVLLRVARRFTEAKRAINATLASSGRPEDDKQCEARTGEGLSEQRCIGEDEHDAETAAERLKDIATGRLSLVRGPDLERRLAELER